MKRFDLLQHLHTLAITGMLMTLCSTMPADPIVKNPDFVKLVAGSNTIPESWQMAEGTGWTFTNEDGINGNHSLLYASRVEQTAPPVTQRVVCQPNTDYVLSAALKSDGTLQPMVRVMDAGNRSVLTQVTADREAGQWRRYASSFNSRGATSLVVELWADTRHIQKEIAPAGACGFDDVQIRLAAEAMDVRAIATTAQFENIARSKPYTFSTAPNYGYCTDPEDRVQLTDGVYTVGYFWTQKTTVGWSGRRPILITIDLGAVESIRGVSYNTAAGVAGVAWPLSVCVLVSDDGKTYHVLGDLVTLSNQRDTPPVERYAVHRYWTDKFKARGRFVQLMLDTGGGYCFVDEVEVYRGEDVWKDIPLTGQTVSNGLEYFKSYAVNYCIKARLLTDLRDAREAIRAAGLGSGVTSRLSKELDLVETDIDRLEPVDPNTFRAVFPMNDLQARIYTTRGKLRRLQGAPALDAWVSHHLDYLTPAQAPDSNSRRRISVAMMRGEWRSAVVNLTSSMEKPAHVILRIEGMPGGVNPGFVTVYEVQWTDTKELKPIGVALTPALRNDQGFIITVPAGMTRQVWFTFHPTTVAPGTHNGRVVMTCPGVKPMTIPLTLRLFPMMFPKRPKLNVGGWDYTDADACYGVTVANRDALIMHLKERFVDSPWGTGSVLPFGSFDQQGNMVKPPSTVNFDKWIDRWPDARRYCVFVAVGESVAGAAMGTPLFNACVKSWIDFWVRYATQKGIEPEKLYLLLLDEPSTHRQDEIIIAWARAIKAAQPKVVLWEDPTYLKPWEAKPEMMAGVDMLCPNRPQMLSEGKPFEDFYRQQKAAGRRLDLYSCSGPMHLLDPYAYVRLQAWSCWDIGAEGSFFWAFGDSGGGDPWNPYMTPGNNYAPMFLAPDLVTPGKHMEAVRESVQDYEYFVMLREAISQANPNHPALAKAQDLLASGARRVLDAENASKLSWTDPKDRWVAEAVRWEILETLTALSK